MNRYIKQLSGTNWKGGNFQVELARLTILTGENQVGKTALADAIRTALIGYSPKHGKTSADMFGFAGARDGASLTGVGATLSDGTTIHHTWKASGKKGAIKYTGSNPVQCPPVLLDIQDYLKKSGPDKVRFVFEQIDLGKLGFGLEQLSAAIKKAVKFEEPTAQTEAALGTLIDEISALDESRHDLSWTLQAWMEAVISKVKEMRDEQLAIAEAMTGTVQGIGQMTAAENQTPVVFDADALAEARKVVERLGGELNGLERLGREITETNRQRAELEELVKHVVDHSAAIAGMEANATALEKQTEGFTSPAGAMQAEMAQLQSQRTIAADELEMLKDQLSIIRDGVDLTADNTAEIAQLERDAAAHDAKIEGFTSPLETLVAYHAEAVSAKKIAMASAEGYRGAAASLQTDMAAALACADCPTCHSKGEGWKKELSAFMQGKIDAQNEAARAADRKAALNQEQIDDCAKKIETERARVQEAKDWAAAAQAASSEAALLRLAQERINNAKAKIAEIDQTVVRQSAAYDKAHAAILELTPKLDLEIKRVEANERLVGQAWAIRKEQKTLRAEHDKGTDTRAKLAACQQYRPGVEQAVARVQGERVAAVTKVEALEAAERTAIAQNSDLKRQAEALEKRTLAEVTVETCKMALKAIEAEKSAVMDKAFADFMDDVRMFADGIFTDRDGQPAKLEYKDGEIGYFYGATWVALNYFSGTQELLAFAGMSVALAKAAPVKVIIMDELGRLSPKNRIALICRVRSLIDDGEIDQFVGIDASGGGYSLNTSNGERIIDLSVGDSAR